MRLDDATVARLGLVASALVLWKSASGIVWGGLMLQSPVAVALVLAVYLASFWMLASAVAEPTAARHGRAALATFALAFASFAYQDAMLKAQSATVPTTDGHVYMDIAARMLLQGKNPYEQSLVEGFRVYRMPLNYSTPLLDADISDRVAYPSLSFLLLVPLVVLHVPTYLAYALCFAAAVGLVAWRAPWWARGLVLALFTLDDTLLKFAFGGVTDTAWALCLVGAILLWRKKPTLAFALVGLACAQKQHPWFLVPYLVVRLWWESGEPPWRGPARRMLVTVALVFLALDLPFFLAAPRAWLLGVFEPLVAPMVQLSEGLTALGMTGYAVIPRGGSTVIFWSLYAYSLFVYARHPRALRGLSWVLPGIVLWFAYRALMSYWYFYALTGVAVLVAGERSEDVEGRWADRPWLPSARLGAGLAALVALFIGWCASRPAPFAVAVKGPIDTWETRAFRLRVHVENRWKRAVRPRFTLQTTSLQPLQWVADFGPRFLAPGESGDYVIRAPRSYNEFDIADGARLAVSDDGSVDVRAFVTIEKDTSIRHVDAVPNPSFSFMETRNYEPFGWAVARSDGGVSVKLAPDLVSPARLTLDFARQRGEELAPPPPPQLAACVIGQRLEDVRTKSRFGYVYTTLALPESELAFGVRVPEAANRPPFATVYGLRLAVPGWVGFVLLGDGVGEGNLPTGEPFVGAAAPRGQWARVRLSLRAVLERMRAPMHERRFTYVRGRDVDVPSVPVEIGLFASATGTDAAAFEFGAIEQATLRPIAELVARGATGAAGRAAWHGELDMEVGNYGKAARYLEEAVAVEPTHARLTSLGDAYLLDFKPAEATKSYARALAMGDSPRANKGMGWALVGVGDAAGALAHFERARASYAESEKIKPRPGLLDTLRGLAVASAKAGDCEGAKRWGDLAFEEEPALPPPVLAGCP